MATPTTRSTRKAPVSGPLPMLGPPTFVGRERELASLMRALSHPPAVALVEGEAGIGKSRLLREVLTALAASSSGRTLVGACPPFREPHTLGPVVDAVRQGASRVTGLRLSPLAGTLRVLLPEWSDELPPAPEPAEDAQAERHRLFRALSELLAAMRVATLVVEDAHWADDATIEFLLYLVAQRPPQFSLVVTYRPEDLAEDSLLRTLSARLSPELEHVRVSLEPLSARGTVALVSSMLQGEPLSDGFAALLYEGTDGVPLAVQESVRLMVDRSDLVLRSDGWARRHMEALAIPPAVRDTVLERVRRMDADAQTVLRAVAVLAEPADAATVIAVSGLPSVLALSGLEQALGSGLIVEDARGRIVSHHALAGRAVLDAMSTRERREMHLRAGRALEAVVPPSVGRLARHFRESGEQAEWSHYAEQAADQAFAAGDERLGVMTLYELIVRIDQPTTSLLRMMNKLLATHLLDHRQLERLALILRSAVNREGTTPGEAARLRIKLARVLSNSGQHDGGRAEVEQALTRPELEPAERASAMTLLGWPLEPSQPASVHRRWLRRAAKVLATVEPPHRYAREIEIASSLVTLGYDEGWSAVAALDEVSAELTPSQLIIRDLNVGAAATMWGRYDEARRRLTQASLVAGKHQYLKMQAAVLLNLARLDWYSGAWPGLHERATDLAENDDLPADIRADARLTLGLLSSVIVTDVDPHDELRSVLAASQRFDPGIMVTSASALAWLLLDDGDVAGALTITDDPIAIVSRKGVWVWATDLASARVATLLAADRVGDAESLIAEFGRGLRGISASAPQASLLLCRALLAQARGTPTRAAARFEAAAVAWAAVPRPHDALLARERRAGCLLAAGDHERGLAELSQVFSAVVALGAQRTADRIGVVLREHGVATQPVQPRGRRSYGDQLSPREREVVELVVDGRTNRQIAEALVVSVNTINSHVKSAMRKLGVSSRTELAALPNSRSLPSPPRSSTHRAINSPEPRN